MFLRILGLIILFIATPLSWGMIYSALMRDKHVVLCSAWIKGTAIMLAVFSFCYNAVTRGAKPERMLQWKPVYWLVVSAVGCMVSCVMLLCRLFKRTKTPVSLIDRHMIPAITVMLLFFSGALILIEPYDQGIVENYTNLYNGEAYPEMHPELTETVLQDIRGEILVDPIVSFYLTGNELVKMGADKFIMGIVPCVFLLLSAGCYDFLADVLCVPKERRSVFLTLIYGLLIVTYMSRDYHLFGIYTNMWEPMTVYVSLFLPLQFGMMIYVMETVYSWDTKKALSCLFWCFVAGMIGYLFRYMDPLLVFAPEAAGAVAGFLRTRLETKETTC